MDDGINYRRMSEGAFIKDSERTLSTFSSSSESLEVTINPVSIMHPDYYARGTSVILIEFPFFAFLIFMIFQGSSSVTIPNSTYTTETRNRHQAPSKSSLRRAGFITKIVSLLKTGKLSDITIKVRDKEYNLHKTILGLQSEHFNLMFEMKRENIPQTMVMDELENFSDEVLNDFFLFLYSESIRHKENAFHLFQLAVIFGVPDLKSDCEEILMENISEDNALEIYNLAQTHKVHDIAKAAFKEIQKKVPELSDSSFNNPELVRNITETKEKLDEFLKRQRSLMNTHHDALN